MKCKMEFSMPAYQWTCKIHGMGMKGDEFGCLAGARERIAVLEAVIADSDRRGTASGLSFPGNAVWPCESRICPQCGTQYGRADISCPGCGHCFICSEHHDLAAELQLGKFIQPDCDMPGDGYP